MAVSNCPQTDDCILEMECDEDDEMTSYITDERISGRDILSPVKKSPLTKSINHSFENSPKRFNGNNFAEKLEIGTNDCASEIKIVYEKKGENCSSKLPDRKIVMSGTQRDDKLSSVCGRPNKLNNTVPTEKEQGISVSVKRILVENNSNVPVIDLTDDAEEEQPSEVTTVTSPVSSPFLKDVLKNFPTLAVVIVPLSSTRNLIYSNGKNKSNLDMKMKEILKLKAEDLTIWLFRKSLISSERHCRVHRNPDLTYKKFKLGKYGANAEKRNIYGGFVWLNDCCSPKPIYLSVFDKTIFDCSHTPEAVLNMIYHWCCQSNIQLVMNLLKVDLIFIEQFYTRMRAVCTAALHEKSCKLGGVQSIVELAVVFMGVNHKSLNTKSLKAIIIGLLDTGTQRTRILAVEPVRDSTVVLSSIKDIVHPSSIIITDPSVDRGILTKIGFRNSQYRLIKNKQIHTNAQILSYVRRIPKIFYNTLNSLSVSQIQQFLNELVWRERWGTTSMDTFHRIIEDIAEQTKVNSSIDHLNWTLDKIACQPQKNWSYSMWKSNLHQGQDCDVLIENSSFAQNVISMSSSSMNKTVTSTAAPKSLITYYYGTLIPKKQPVPEDRFEPRCPLCKAFTSTTPKLIEHLIKQHVVKQVKPGKTEICLYCLKTCSTRYNLKTHHAAFHEKKKSMFSCLICEENFFDSTRLSMHMQKNHCELDLPYRCGICSYRTSENSVIVKHFRETHVNANKLWCPVCFKIVSIERNREANVILYLKHIARHLTKPLVIKCSKCVLNFIHVGKLKEHEIADHKSCKDIPGVVRYSGAGPPMHHMMTGLKNKCSSIKTNNKYLEDIQKIQERYTITEVQTVKINGLSSGLECFECEGSLSDHSFSCEYFCTECKYMTRCRVGIEYHIYKNHLKLKTYNEYEESIVSKTIKCWCGFETQFGNRLAKHVYFCQTVLFKNFSENILNSELKQAIIKSKVDISQIEETPDVLLSTGLIRRK